MTLTLSILLVRVLHRDFFVREVLSVHVVDGIIRSLEGSVGNEAIPFAEICIIASNLRRCNERPKAREGLVECLLIDHSI